MKAPLLRGSQRPLERELHEGVFVRSIYFQDPDGILLEFASWTRALNEADIRHVPRRAADAASMA